MPDNVFSNDKPLTDPDDDLLGYADYARNIANGIQNMTPPDGLVMAIHGPWGSGKSTLIEFILHSLSNLKEKGDEEIKVIRFNPWWFTTQESLTHSFFDHLTNAFQGFIKKGGKSLYKKLSDFGDIVGEVPGVGIAKVIPKFRKMRTKTAEQLKEEISADLRKRNKKLLVIIDDIDRLNAEEIQQLFMLIKAVADFPNVVYLLAFDRAVVANALSNVVGGDGERFLEKIVQVPLAMPTIEEYHLQELFFNQISAITGPLPKRFYNKGFIHDDYYRYLKFFLNNPRDIVRLANVLTLTYTSIRDEVNVSDFITIESLRLFKPEIYNLIRENKDSFTGIGNQTSAIIDYLNKQPRHTQSLLKYMFPHIDNPISDSQQQKYRKDLRIANPETFDNYFKFGIPVGNASKELILELIDKVLYGEDLTDYFKSEASVNIRRYLNILDRLDDYAGELKPANIYALALNILDANDFIYEKESNVLQQGAKTINDLFYRINLDNRLKLFKKLLSETKSVIMSTMIVTLMGHYYGLYTAKSERYGSRSFLEKEDFADLDGILAPRILRYFTENTDLSIQNIDRILNYLKYADKPSMEKIAGTLLKDPDKLIRFLEWYSYSLSNNMEKLFLYFGKSVLKEKIEHYIATGQYTGHELKQAELFLKNIYDHNTEK